MSIVSKFSKTILNKGYYQALVRKALPRVKAVPSSVEAALDFAFMFKMGPSIRGLELHIRPAQVRLEFTKLAQLVKDMQPKNILEIGTATGGSLLVWTRCLTPGGRVISIDLPWGQYGAGYVSSRVPLYKAFALPEQRMELLQLNSHDNSTVEQIASTLDGEQLDFLFIDGDHTYEGVREDFERYSPFMRPGGVIAFHDIAKPIDGTVGVWELWQELKTKHRCIELVENPDQGWAGIGVLYVG